MTSAVTVCSRWCGGTAKRAGFADDCGDLMTGRERLLGEGCPGGACRAEDNELPATRYLRRGTCTALVSHGT